MFLVGLLTGIVLVCALLWLRLLWEARFSLHSARLFDPRSDISGMERQTIRQMLDVEMAMRGQAPADDDAIEGTAHEITPRP